MSSIEQFLDLLEQKNLIVPDLLEGLRQRVAGLPDNVTAGDFASRLVANGVLTSASASQLLEELSHGEKTPPPPVSQQPPPLPAVSPPPPALSDPPLPVDVPPAAHFAPTSQSVAQVTRRLERRAGSKNVAKNMARKRKATNPWESKLILYGAGGLVVLLLVGFFLFGSLFRRSADAMFAEADGAYQKALYSEAILAYTEFVDAFPSDTNAQTARIRRALARIRLLVDAKSDWEKSLATAETELKAVAGEPNFFEGANAELANLLPEIAAGLAKEAWDKTSIKHAEQAEKALKLIDEYLPRSLRPAETLAGVQYQIDQVRRALAHDKVISETQRELDALFAVPDVGPRQVEQAYQRIDTLLVEYPELENIPAFLVLPQLLAKNEHRAVTVLEEASLAKPSATERRKKNAEEIAVTYFNQTHKQLDLKNAMPVCVYAGGAVFGLEAQTGRPLWKRAIDVPDSEFVASPKVVPMPLADDGRPCALVVETKKWSLLQLDLQTGEELFRLPVNEPFYLSTPRLSVPAADTQSLQIAFATASGKVCLVTFQGGKQVSLSGFQLPQNATSPPLIDVAKQSIYQLANQNTLFILPLNQGQEPQSLYCGQKPASVRMAPVGLGENLLVFRRRDAKVTDMDVFSSEKGSFLTFQLRGLVDTPPAEEGNYLAVTTGLGDTRLFEKTDDPLDPLKQIASGSVADENEHMGMVRSVALAGNDVWVADRQLMRFAPQRSQSRLLPQETVRKDIVSLTSPSLRENVLFHPFRERGRGGYVLEAVSLTDKTVAWETELADPIVQEPNVLADGNIHVLTSSGKRFRVEKDFFNAGDSSTRFVGTPVTKLPRGAFGSAPLGEVVILEGGFEAWIPRRDSGGDSARTVMLFDPGAAEVTRFRPMLFPSPMAASPTALTGKLLVPLADGQLALYDPKTGQPAAAPFVATIIPLGRAGGGSGWSAPTVLNASSDPDEFLIADNSPNALTLYHLALENATRPPQIVLKTKVPLQSSAASAIAATEQHAVLVDAHNVLQVFRIGQGTEQTQAAKQIPLSAPCVWGPYVVHDSCLLATSDGKLHCVNAEGNIQSVDSASPIGKPWVESDGVVLTSLTGRLWKLNVSDLKTIFSHETDIPTLVGAVRFGGHYILCGKDGSISRVNSP